MKFIIICRDELGDETRVGGFYASAEVARRAIPAIMDRYPEFTDFGVEEYQDASYWSQFYHYDDPCY